MVLTKLKAYHRLQTEYVIIYVKVFMLKQGPNVTNEDGNFWEVE